MHSLTRVLVFVVAVLALALPVWAQEGEPVIGGLKEQSAEVQASVLNAVAEVKPALVRIMVVSTYYRDGRENKSQSAGSGVIISEDGYVVTNHHVAGHATRLVCTLADKEEIEAELVGKDAMSDIAVIRLLPEEPRTFPVAAFGNSAEVEVGERVLAMGSPMAFSQSVTLGIVSNVELVMPEWLRRGGSLTLDGEDVGALVRWIAHDAQIYGGNSGGPLVNLNGEIIGINEISVAGLGGAIPGNLAKEVAEELIAKGEVERSWLGITVQPLLKTSGQKEGVLVSSVLEGGPSEGVLEAGDIVLEVAGAPIEVRYAEQLPLFNQQVSSLPVGEPVEIVVLRDGNAKVLELETSKREKAAPDQVELKQWGVTARDLSFILAKELKRDTSEGVLVTSVRTGGPAGDAKPQIERGDVIVEVGGAAIANLEDLEAATDNVTADAEEPVPAIVHFDRKTQRLTTVVEVGIKELEDPGLEVKKAWLPVETQVLTRDISEEMGEPDLTGFIVTKVYENTTAEAAGLKVGDMILEVDGEPLVASAPEDYEELAQLIRQYRVGTTAELAVRRDAEAMTVPVELVRSPELPREMKRYRDEQFNFTVRDITFFDRADERWPEDQQGVLAEEVQSGGWADLALLSPGDLILAVGGEAVTDVEAMEAKMDVLAETEPESVVIKVLRGIHTMFLEIEPKWDDDEAVEGEKDES